MSAKPSFFAELQRRHVYKVGAMYCVAGWLLVQVVTQVFPVFHVSDVAQQIMVLAVVAGFPVALVLAWLFDLTPRGIVRTAEMPAAGETPDAVRQRRGAERKLNYLLGALLALAAGYIALGHTLPRSAATAGGDDKSIAVLPFENLSDDKANAYFAEGMQDEILTRLARVGALKVISRTSTAHYASSPDNLPQIARELGVASILEGSVQKAGDAVHINVQLIRAATDEHLWAESYNRKLDDVFGVEGEVAQTIAERLKATLTGTELQQVTARLTDNPAAYDAYLRGLAYSSRGDAFTPNTQAAIEALQEAVRLDPGFAAAWAWLARGHAFAYWYFDRSDAQKDAARAALQRAVALAPDAPETLEVEAFCQYWLDRDYEGARARFEQILKATPNDARVIYALAAIDRRQGRWGDSLPLFRQSVELDPRNMQLAADAASTAVAMREPRIAQQMVDQGLERVPDDPGELSVEVSLLLAQGRVEEVQRLLDRMHIDAGDDILVWSYYYNAVLSRRYGPAIELLKQQLATPEALGPKLGQFQFWLADLQARAGDADAARLGFEHSRISLQAALRLAPADDDLVEALATTEGRLGEHEAALADARRAIALMPASRDAFAGPSHEEALVRLQARAGDKDAAIAGLQHLLGVPYGQPPPTPALLRLDPDFDKLRDDPRFLALTVDGKPPALITP